MIYSNNVVLRVSDVSTGIAKPDSKPGPCDDDKAYYVRVTGVPKGGIWSTGYLVVRTYRKEAC